VIDVASPPARLVYLRDLTRLGLPFPIELEAEDGSAPSDAGASSGSGSAAQKIGNP